MHKATFTLSLFLCFLTVCAQNQDHCRRVSYLTSLNTERLARKLTKNLETDSQKVYAIHCWITHHIRYDVRKFLNFDYSYVPVRKILLRRKALCSGFSELFNELCYSSGVTSVSVSGYSNTLFNDLHDRYYMEDHSWNAVFCDGEWKLIDATWDAGYIKFFRRTIPGYFVYVISFGRRDILKYRPKFIRAPGLFYFYRDGLFFSTDHIPSLPAWQLLNPVKTIGECEADSSFYFYNYRESAEDSRDTSMEIVRSDLSSLKANQEIFNNLAKFNFNRKNQFTAARYYFLVGREMHEKTDFSGGDSAKIAARLDFIEKTLNTALLHCDSNRYFLRLQKQELKEKNRLKNEINRNNYNRLNHSSTRSARSLISAAYTAKAGKQAAFDMRQYGRSHVSLLSKSRKFYYTRPARQTREKETVLIRERIQKLELLEDSVNNSLEVRFQVLDSLENQLIQSFSAFMSNSVLFSSMAKTLCELRLNYLDDLDLIPFTISDRLLKEKTVNDTLLFNAAGNFIVTGYYLAFISIKKDLRKLYKCHRAISAEYCRLKKKSTYDPKIYSGYRQNLEKYKDETRKYNSKLRTYVPEFNKIRHLCINAWYLVLREKKIYREQRSIEKKLYKVRGNYINRRYLSLVHVTTTLKKDCLKEISYIKKARRRL